MLKFLDEFQVAEVTGRKVQTLRNDRLRRQGIPYVKFGKSVRYELADIEEFVALNKVATKNMKRVQTRPLSQKKQTA
jgi:hypothetical protein